MWAHLQGAAGSLKQGVKYFTFCHQNSNLLLVSAPPTFSCSVFKQNYFKENISSRLNKYGRHLV